MMQEVWHPVVGYEGLYEVSSQGRVRSLDRARCRGRVLRQAVSADGYYWTVSLSGHGRRCTRTVHSLVAAAFLGPKPDGLMICHGPGGSRVNAIGNLSYGTCQQNQQDRRRDGTAMLGELHFNASITDAQAIEIRRRVLAGEMQKVIALELGVSANTVNRCVKRRTFAHLP